MGVKKFRFLFNVLIYSSEIKAEREEILFSWFYGGGKEGWVSVRRTKREIVLTNRHV